MKRTLLTSVILAAMLLSACATTNVISIKAGNLYLAYSENPVAADAKYQNKTLNISGEVLSIFRDNEGIAHVLIASEAIVENDNESGEKETTSTTTPPTTTKEGIITMPSQPPGQAIYPAWMLQSILIRFDKSHDSQILELHMGQELEVMGICRGLNSDNSVVVDAK